MFFPYIFSYWFWYFLYYYYILVQSLFEHLFTFESVYLKWLQTLWLYILSASQVSKTRNRWSRDKADHQTLLWQVCCSCDIIGVPYFNKRNAKTVLKLRSYTLAVGLTNPHKTECFKIYFLFLMKSRSIWI